MKYYGINRKIRIEKMQYRYQKSIMKLRSLVPGSARKSFKLQYHNVYEMDYSNFRKYNNGLSDDDECSFYEFVTLDLISRDNIDILQKGIKKLIQYNRSSHFLNLHTDSVETVLEKINNMDSSLLNYIDEINCGLFDFDGTRYKKWIRYFTLSVVNVNTTFLGVKCVVTIADNEEKKIDELIKKDYHEDKGYPEAYIYTKSYNQKRMSKRKIYKMYTTNHYNDSSLKADKIYELITCVEWKFYEAIKNRIPLVLHNKGIIPPRIDILGTNISYRNYDDYNFFWSSLGIFLDNRGQFIDDNHRIIYHTDLSGRYTKSIDDSRLIWIYKKDGVLRQSVYNIEGEIDVCIKDYATHFFRFMLLNILSSNAGTILVEYKRKLESISLRRNKYGEALKLYYNFEKDIDSYRNYVKDKNWEQSRTILGGLFFESNYKGKSIQGEDFIGYNEYYIKTAIESSDKINEDIKMLSQDFERKSSILQHLFDYRNIKKTWRIGTLTMIIALLTLIASLNAETIKDFICKIIDFFSKSLNLLG